MRSALFVPPFDELADPRELVGLAVEAEEHGWDGFFVWDHVSYRAPVQALADPWVALSAVATRTERLLLGPMVTPLPRRRPVVLARQTASLDVLSGGRLVLGVGLGGDGSGELSRTGEELDPRVRAQLLDEGLEVLAAAWSGEPVRHRGTHLLVDDVTFLPTPVQRPRVPVWVGARYGNPAPLRRAARWDGVFPVDLQGPDSLAEVAAAVAEHRGDLDGYEVVAGVRPGVDPEPYAAAGATWHLVAFPYDDCSRDTVRGVLRDGPPRRG